MIAAAADGKLTVGELIAAFGDRSLGALLVLPCILVILPIGMIPGVPGIAAGLMILIAAQMIAGTERLWLPGRLTRMVLPSHRVARALARMRPWARWLDTEIGSRFAWFAESRFAARTIGVVTIIGSVITIVIGFIPGLPALVCLPILLFGLGMLAQNGLLVLLGYVLCGGVAWIVLALV